MNIIALAGGKEVDREIADAFIAGVHAHGIAGQVRDPAAADPMAGADVVAMIGVKSRAFFEMAAAQGKQRIILDKGYTRTHAPEFKLCKYWRVSVNSHHPTRYLVGTPPGYDRLNTIDITMKPWREFGSKILFAGSSEKFHRFTGLDHPTAYAGDVIQQIQKHTPLPVVYRPKPSWRDAVPIDGAGFSPPKEKLTAALQDVWAMVTHGSNACFEAVLSGVPCIILGDAVARPISSTGLAMINAPRLASDADKANWLAHLSYCQWSLAELASGEAWLHIGRHLDPIF